MKNKKSFTPEYKKEIVKLVTERGKKASEVAEDIGVPAASSAGTRNKISIHKRP
jgi:transposase